MIYIYDIIVNFNKDLYDFYDWTETDIIEHIRKVPLIRVNSKSFSKILNKNILINKTLLEKIYNKTEIYSNKILEKVNYGVLISNGNNIIAVIFTKNGVVDKYSRLLIDEELEIKEIAKNLDEFNLEYKIINNKNLYNRFTRQEKRKINVILNELTKIKNNKEIEKLSYLYFEWFNKENTNENFYEELINNIKQGYSQKHEDFIKLLNIIESKNNV